MNIIAESFRDGLQDLSFKPKSLRPEQAGPKSREQGAADGGCVLEQHFAFLTHFQTQIGILHIKYNNILTVCDEHTDNTSRRPIVRPSRDRPPQPPRDSMRPRISQSGVALINTLRRRGRDTVLFTANGIVFEQYRTKKKRIAWTRQINLRLVRGPNPASSAASRLPTDCANRADSTR
ncbi:hypothetical protein EVAR_9829_1 [Eumeta japonica]|uniref:Uncharacterized protein n=1 Tax=Eumeta variegata TaxID=151549 RepID=A0A4C1U6R1_EUMVA|nr:hypothetical protein EVAR_9829_1 [Eumeta japonica]